MQLNDTVVLDDFEISQIEQNVKKMRFEGNNSKASSQVVYLCKLNNNNGHDLCGTRAAL